MVRRRPRHFRAVVAGASILALLVGVWIGGHPQFLPGPLRSLFLSKEVRTYHDALDLIQDDYYRKVSRGHLSDDALRGLVAGLHDQFSQYFDPRTYEAFKRGGHEQISGIGITVLPDRRGLRVNSVVSHSPAAQAGIRVGDVIVRAQGRRLARRPASFSTHLIRGRPGTFVRLAVARGRRVRVLRVRRARISEPSVEARLRRVGGVKLADVQLSTFSEGVHDELEAALTRELHRGARGVLLDLRGNGGGLLNEAVLVAGEFLDGGIVVTTEGRTRPKHVFRAGHHPVVPHLPVVVLVDGGTASASEIVTAALQDHGRAKVVGTRTYGKGVFQEVAGLPNGGGLDITVGEYFTPHGRNLGGGGVRRGAGVHPDVRATDRPGRARDEALDKALRLLAREARQR